MIRKFSLDTGMLSTKFSLAMGMQPKTGAAHPPSKNFQSTPPGSQYEDVILPV